jgi:hypothetical protein
LELAYKQRAKRQDQILGGLMGASLTADILKEAKVLKLQMTSRQARALERECLDKLERTMKDAQAEIVRAEVERFWLDEENRELNL